jgi:hypothetical protein
MYTFLKCVLLIVFNNIVIKSLNNFHVSIYPWLGGVYQGGGGGVRRNIENVSVIFVFPKLKFIFLLKEV